MAWAPLAIAAVGTILSVAGSEQQASARRFSGRQTAIAKELEAQQFETQAGQELAASQRRASEQQRRARLVASRALAVSAASGAGASDPTIQNIISDIAGEGSYRSGVELYQGEERARQLTMGAEASRFEGRVAAEGGELGARAYNYQALGTGLYGASSLYAKYGMGGPKTSANYGVLDEYQLFSGEGMSDPRFG